ncbi:3'-5' exonuclease [Leptolyngbyaceae cyanobacterium CCMR0081]|uniref:3'-5' exonuclease n=2 Tax=Adonisia TaxID=2950183 RepID=A0A6M0RMS7_9CYAN|nr:3'-5' exonuclease [Adonisia turfae]NEZ57587.1 3'-5' exonuclease [Adonisia turfae CCMR0081]
MGDAQATIKLTVYNWWGEPNSPPEHLKTKRQLGSLGLKPVQPVGVIHTLKYDCYLYDPNDIASAQPKRKCSPAQLAALERGRKKSHFKKLYREYSADFWIEYDRINAVNWAREQLKNPNLLILDIETTGLKKTAHIIEIAIINGKGETLLNSLCQPVGHWTIDPGAIAIHGIQSEQLSEAPSFGDLYSTIKLLLKDSFVLIYGSQLDNQVLETGCKLCEQPALQYQSDCLMLWYSQWRGDWSSYHGDYRWQALGGGHRALADCQTALTRLQEIADDSSEFQYPIDLVQAAEDAGVELAATPDY